MIIGELINTMPCPGPSTCALVVRTVFGSLDNTGQTVSGNNNMSAWLAEALAGTLTGTQAQYNINNVPWGYTEYAVFDTFTDTIPTGGVAYAADGGHPFSRTDWWEDGPSQVPSPTSDIVVSQIWLGAPRAFMVIAGGFTLQAQGGRGISVEGCTFTPASNSACGSLILTLPQPDINLGYDCWEYIFALVGPNATGGQTGQYPDLATFEADQINNRGTNWNPNQLCKIGLVDPLTGNVITGYQL